MVDTRKIVKVFLASPGDLAEERKTAKSVVDEFNSLMAEEFGYQVELVGWEDTVSVYGRPQEVINRDLDRCELFVGLMWKKWGTRPSVTGPYTSGFEEEFETSVQRRVSKGGPEISLFFKEIDPAFLADPGEDLRRVQAFKQKLIAEKKILFEGFGDIPEFEKKFRRCIFTYVRNLREKDKSQAAAKNQTPTTGGEQTQASVSVTSAPETPLSAEGATFLREIVLKSTEENITATEVARFRLLANLVGKEGNDDRWLGVHDANLLFAARAKFNFGRKELVGLVATGLRHYSDENTPLWCWLAAVNGFEDGLLLFYSLAHSNTAQHIGALTAMRLIGEQLNVDVDKRNKFIKGWFAQRMSSNSKVAALGYLAEYGTASDLAVIRHEYDKGDNQTVAAAADAMIRINSRDSREKAIAALYELQPSDVSDDVLHGLFDKVTTTETLLSGISQQSAKVRHIVVSLLRDRGALPNETAERLLNDDDAAVRYEALMSLVATGRTFSDAEAERILVKPFTGAGLIGALGVYGSRNRGQDYFEQFQKYRLRSLKDDDLEKAAAEESIFDRTAELTLTERFFGLRAEELRRNVDDQYKAAFSRALNGMAEKLAGSDGAQELIEKIRSLENSLRKKFTRQGLDLICRKAEPGDLGRVRSTLRSGFVDYSAWDMQYLQKFGEWEDIDLIIEAVKRPTADAGASIFASARYDSKYREAAEAIFKLGRARLSEVFAMAASPQLLSYVIAQTPDKAFRSLSDATIMRLLRLDDEKVRKVAALKCVRALPERRVSNLLRAYMRQEAPYYYNVVHWLDFGVSTPKDHKLVGVKKALNTECGLN